jgi:hypothetical protein
MVAIQETTKNQQTYQQTHPTFEQMRALYTLVMTVLFQTAGTMVSKTVQESATTTTATTVPSNSKELNRRLKAAQSLKEKTKLIRRITSPLNFWETQNLIQNHQSQTTTKMPIAPYFQHHRSQDKCQTRPSSTISSKTSQKAQNPQTKWIQSSSTPLELQSLSTGGQDQLKNKKMKEGFQQPQTQVCPIHSAKTQNCLACQVKGTSPVTMSPEFLMKINISDHMLRQATQAVQRKRKIMQQQQQQIKIEFSEIRQTRVNNRNRLPDAAQ